MNITFRGNNAVNYHGTILHHFKEYAAIKQQQRADGVYRSASYAALANLRFGSPDLLAMDDMRDWCEWLLYGGCDNYPIGHDIRRAAETYIFHHGKQDIRPDSEYILEDDVTERQKPLEA